MSKNKKYKKNKKILDIEINNNSLAISNNFYKLLYNTTYPISIILDKNNTIATSTTSTASNTIDLSSTSSINYISSSCSSPSLKSSFYYTPDPYAELEEMRLKEEEDEELRKKYPALQEAYDQYQLIKKMVKDEECDKYFNNRMKIFKNKD